MEKQESWGKGLVILTIIIAVTITGVFFISLTAEAKHGYHTQIKAKEVALKLAAENKKSLEEARIKEVIVKAKKLQTKTKVWLTVEDAKKADAFMKRSDCIACHNPAIPTIIAPQFVEIAKKYVGADDKVINQLIAKVRKGGQGNWQPKYVGFMTPHIQFLDGKKITNNNIELMIKRVLDAK